MNEDPEDWEAHERLRAGEAAAPREGAPPPATRADRVALAFAAAISGAALCGMAFRAFGATGRPFAAVLAGGALLGLALFGALLGAAALGRAPRRDARPARVPRTEAP